MCCMMPKEVIRPRTRLSKGIGIAAAEEIRLHIHLLDGELAFFNSIVNPLMAGIKTTRMPHQDRKSTRLNSSHVAISYAVFCLKKKKSKDTTSHTVANSHT